MLRNTPLPSLPTIRQSVNVGLPPALICTPDVAVVDIQLQGDIDGIETAKELISRYGIGVVFVTAFSDKSIRTAAAELRPAAFLLKPFQPTDLVNAIRTALAERGARH